MPRGGHDGGAQENGPGEDANSAGPQPPFTKPPRGQGREPASQSMARAIRQTKSAPKLARDKQPLPSKLRPSEPQALALPRRYFSTPRSLRVLHPLPTHFLSFTSSPPSSGKSPSSFGLCPRAPRAGEPGPRLTRPHGPLLGPPSTPSVARLALAHAPRGLLLPAHAECDLCTLPPAVT